jgi:hypothetical protein
MTSEVEHDILVGHDGAWGGGHGAAGGAGGAQGPQESEALAAAEAAAAAARSALSCAQVWRGWVLSGALLGCGLAALTVVCNKSATQQHRPLCCAPRT